MIDNKRDFKVGYKRPPRNGQFKPGESGNPRGRQKPRADFKADLMEELRQLTPIWEDGRERMVSKQRAFIKALVGAAIKSDMRAITALASLCTRAIGNEPERAGEASSDDVELWEQFVSREVRRRTSQGGPDGD
jgi:Family of unknown function (DUF5681)